MKRLLPTEMKVCVILSVIKNMVLLPMVVLKKQKETLNKQ